jgi:nucleoside-diphosphate-sugar epimerase
MDIAGVQLEIDHVHGAVGVRGRNSDNDYIKAVLGWEPTTPLLEGLEKTYAWVYDQVKEQLT